MLRGRHTDQVVPQTTIVRKEGNPLPQFAPILMRYDGRGVRNDFVGNRKACGRRTVPNGLATLLILRRRTNRRGPLDVILTGSDTAKVCGRRSTKDGGTSQEGQEQRGDDRHFLLLILKNWDILVVATTIPSFFLTIGPKTVSQVFKIRLRNGRNAGGNLIIDGTVR
jgi:hypothetical protein